MESIFVVLRSLIISNSNVDIKELLKKYQLEARLSLNLEYIVLNCRRSDDGDGQWEADRLGRGFYIVSLTGPKSSLNEATGTTPITAASGGSTTSLMTPPQSLVSNSLLSSLMQGSGAGSPSASLSATMNGGQTTSSVPSASLIYNREYLDKEMTMLPLEWTEDCQERVEYTEWVSPHIINNTVQLYNSTSNNNVTIPNHLCLIDSKHSLHLYTIFKSENIKIEPSTTYSINDVKLRKKLSVITLYESSGANIKTFQNHHLHHVSVSFDKLMSMLDIGGSATPPSIEMISNGSGAGDTNGSIVLLIQRSLVVYLKIKQIDSFHYLFYIHRKFNLALNNSPKEIVQNIHTRLPPALSDDDLHLIKRTDKWIFLLNIKTSQIDIFLLNGKKRGIINTKAYLHRNSITVTESHEFIDFTVSSDLLNLSILDGEGNIYVLSIDDYFQGSTPQLLYSIGVVSYVNSNSTDDDFDILIDKSSGSQDAENGDIDESADVSNNNREESNQTEEAEDEDEDGEDEDDAEGEGDYEMETSNQYYIKVEDINNKNDIFLFHWFETDESLLTLNESQSEFNSMIHWLPRKPQQKYQYNGFHMSSTGQVLKKTTSPALSRENSFASVLQRSTSLNEISLSSYSANAFNQIKQLPTYAINSCFKLTLPEGALSRDSRFSFFVTPKLIICIIYTETSSTFHFYDRYDSSAHAERKINERATLMMLNDQNFYFITENGFNALLVAQNQQQILNNLIMFEGSESANHLCALNNWNKRDLKIHALHLGLKYRQLDVVEPVLKSLDPDQQFIGSQLLVNTILENSSSVSSANVPNESYCNEMLQIGMNFIGLIIRDRASLVHQSLSKLNQSMTEINWTETLTTPINESNLSLLSLNGGGYFGSSSAEESSGNHVNGSSPSSPTSPIQDLLHFTTVLESLRMFQKQQQQPPSSPQVSSDHQQPPTSRGGNRSRSLSMVPQAAPVDISSWFASGLVERWDRLEELEIIKESLMNGTISSAIAYINWRREKTKQLSSSVSSNQAYYDSDSNLPKFIPSTGHLTLDHIQKISSCFIYQAISQDQLDQALKLLTTLGIPITANLEQLAFSTSRRNIRSLLIEALKNHPTIKDQKLFTPEIKQIIEFSLKLEKLYPSISFHREFSRLSFKWRPFAESKPPLLIQQQQQLQFYQNGGQLDSIDPVADEDIKLLCQEVDDVLPDTEHHYGFQIVTHGSALSTSQNTNVYSSGFLRGNTNASNLTGSQSLGRNRIVLYPPITQNAIASAQDYNLDGYSHFSLNNLVKWTDESKERILIEKKYEIEKRDLVSLLFYYISHNQYQQVDWISLLNTDQIQYLRNLTLKNLNIPHSQATQSEVENEKLYQSILKALSIATPSMKEIFLNHLSRHRIVLLDAERLPILNMSPIYQKENSDHFILLKRLSKNHLLFPEMNGTLNFQSFPLNYILPVISENQETVSLEFHKFFIQFCIQERLYQLLSSYILAYGLNVNSEENRLKLGIELHKLEPSIQLLFLQKSRTKIDQLKANIINLVPLLDQSQENEKYLDLRILDKNQVRSQISIYFEILNKILEKYPNRPLLPLSSLIFAPCKVKNLLLHITDQGARLNNTILLGSIQASYPTFHSILSKVLLHHKQSQPGYAPGSPNVNIKPRDIISSKLDISLSEILDSNSLFNLSNLFGTVNQDSLRLLIPEFSNETFKEGYLDNLDVFYYLEKGRPSEAVQLLSQSGVEWTDRQKHLLAWILRIWAIQHIHQKKSVSSVIVLLDLMKLEEYAQMVKVDIGVAKRIITKRSINGASPDAMKAASPLLLSSSGFTSPPPLSSLSSSPSISDGKLTESTKFNDYQLECLNLFISIYPTPDSMVVKRNSVAPDSPIQRIISKFENTIPQTLGAPIVDFNSKGYLLSKFCQAHAIPKITRRLEFLAENNAWLEFLYEAEIQELPLPQVKEIVRKFTNLGIRNHLLLVIEGLSNERKRQYVTGDGSCDEEKQDSNIKSNLLQLSHQYYSIEESTLNNDIIGYLLSSFRSNDPANFLLYNATKDKRPLLAVIANCVGNGSVTTIECLVTWLCVNSPTLTSLLTGKNETSTHPFEDNNSDTVDDSFDFDLEALDISLDHHYVPTVTKFGYDDLIRSVQHILQSRKTFILLEGFKIFIPDNILLNYLKFINQFHQYRFEDSQESLFNFIQDLEKYQPSPEDSNNNYLKSKESVRTLAIELSENLLDLLSSYEREHFLSILHKSNLSNVFSTLHSTLNLLKRTQLEDKNIRMDPKVIIQHLLEKGLFSEARNYSKENQLDNDIVTLAEVDSLVSHYKHGCLWDMEQERINLWKKSQQYFVQYNCKPAVAGEYFFNRSLLVPPSKEKILLLSMCAEWFEKLPYISPEKREFIDDLKNQQLLISVGLSIEEDNNLMNLRSSGTIPMNETFDEEYGYNDSEQERNSHINSFFASPIPSPSQSLSSSPENDSPIKDYLKRPTHHNNSNSQYLQSHPISSLRLSSETSSQSLSSSSSLVTLGEAAGGITIDSKGLDSVIAKLLNCSNFYQADQICQQFNFKNLDYEIITTMLKIVNRQIPPNPKAFSPNLVLEMMQNKIAMKWVQSSVSNFEASVENILFALDILSSCCLLAKTASLNIITKFNVAEKLHLSYSDLESQNPYQIVNTLLKSLGKECFRLLKSFIHCCHLDYSQINLQLADLFANAVINSFTPQNGSSQSQLSSSPSSSSSSSKMTKDIDPHWTSEEFHEYIRIGRDPYAFGMRLIEKSSIDVELINHSFENHSPSLSPKSSPSGSPPYKSKIEMEAEGELFIRAHFCFVVACSVDGTILVLNIVKSLIHHYADAGKYKLLVRLITGTQCYNELQGIFDILLEHDRFELLLRKKIHQHEDQNGLKLALNSYLLKKQPMYQDKLSMLYLRFNMFKEIAQNHEQTARTRLEGLSKDKSTSIAAFNKELMEIMKGLLDAADSYSKERSHRTAQSCIALGALVALQIRSPEPKIINLRINEARAIFVQKSNFKEAVILANAYSLNNYSEWINALFQQVLVVGNFVYLTEYLSYFSSNNNLFYDLIKRYKTDTKIAKAQHVKYLIQNIVTDRNIKLELAKDLQFDDIVKQNQFK